MIQLIRTHLKGSWWLIALVCGLQLVQTLTALLLPSLNADIIDRGIIESDIPYIWRLGLVMLAFSAVGMGAQILAAYLSARVSMRLGRDLRQSLFTRVFELGGQEISRIGSPSLITRTTNDVQQVQMMVHMFLTMIVTAPLMLIGGVIMALREDVGLSSVLVFVIPALVLVLAGAVRRLMPYFRKMQGRIDKINGVFREQIEGIRVIRAFVREDREEQRFTEASTALRDVATSVGKLFSLVFPAVFLVVNIGTLAVMWLGGHRVDSGSMDVGAITAFIAYLMFILFAIMMTSMVFMMAPRALVSAERIVEVLNTEPEILPPAHPITPTKPQGIVEFDSVGFGYPGADQPVLHNISFTARPGQITAIIGSTGSGKSTLINLIPRLFDTSQGSIRIDGVNIRDLDPNFLKTNIGLVPQQSFLFTGTVASNLKFGREDATEEEMWQALRIAQAEEFVRDLPAQLDTEIAQGGTSVSGGQRQRLSIARAIIRRPLIYLFDDSFSALDYRTDAALRQALQPVAQESTVIVVAQRVATIRDAGQIIVLDEGRIVGIGTHEDLLQTCTTYQEIVHSQISAQEAAS